MPANGRAKRERIRRAQRLAREAESTQARDARLVEDRASHSRAREAETTQARDARLAQKRASHSRASEAETTQARDARLAENRASHSRAREAETTQVRESRLAQKRASHSRTRSNESPETSRAKRQRMREAKRSERDIQLDPARDVRLTVDRARHREMHSVRLEQARHGTNNLARCDDTDFFQEALHGEYRHTLSKTSLFQCPHCSHCGALVWKEERKGFCCNSGKTDLTYNPTAPKPGSIPPRPPTAIVDLFLNQNFVKQAKQYNNALAMASIGVREIPIPGFNPGVRIQGKVYHYIAGPLPEHGRNPLFAQIYFHDPDHELQNRRAHTTNSSLNEDFLLSAQRAIHECNPYVQQFKSAIEYLAQNESANESANELKIVLADRTRRRDLHRGTINLPSPDSDVAVIAPGATTTEQFGKLAVTLHLRGGQLQTIDAMHPAYDPLSYVLLLPCGSQGYHSELAKITPTSFYRYHLQVRDPAHHFNLLLRGGKLTQQYVCDMMAKIESHRLNWIRYNQKSIKAEKYKVIVDALNSDAEVIPGRLTILPPSMYASPRWYAKEFQDAMALVRVKGKPDFFLTFTCNPKWPEITGSLFEGQPSIHRPDIVARVFHMKVEALLTDLLKRDILGHVDAYVMVKETQKRHLPHIHMLLTIVPRDKPRTSADVDRVVSAEIPNKDTNPELHRIVTSHMIHGPCGEWNNASPCMADRKCTKDYPKVLRQTTSFSDDSYPLYRRRTEGAPGAPIMKTIRGGVHVSVSNAWVVPYNPYILLRYDAHINLEIVCAVTTVKYLYKYLQKGPDQCLVRLDVSDEMRQRLRYDEVTQYELGRYITASEGFWRIYDFPIQRKRPPVEMLAIHLEDEQVIYIFTLSLFCIFSVYWLPAPETPEFPPRGVIKYVILSYRKCFPRGN